MPRFLLLFLLLHLVFIYLFVCLFYIPFYLTILCTCRTYCQFNFIILRLVVNVGSVPQLAVILFLLNYHLCIDPFPIYLFLPYDH